MKCTNCGARLMETDQFCPKCGARAIKEKRCQGCGAVLRDGVKFCPECGKPVAASGNARKVPDETIDIPIDAIERNILSETEAEIKADKKKEGAVRRTTAPGGTAARSDRGRAASSGGGAPRNASERGGASRSASVSKGTATGRTPSHSAPARGESPRQGAERDTMAHNGASRSAGPRSGQARKLQEEPVMKRKSGSPIPPQKKRPVYREEDWEEEDWEEEDFEDDEEDWEEEDYEDDGWDDDDDEGVDVITVMTAIVGCAVLIVVAVLGFNLYKQYMPKAYSDTASEQQEEEEEQQQESGEGQNQPEEQQQGSDQSIEIEADAGAEGRETYKLTVTSETVNVRDQPSTSGTNVLKKAHEGETYTCYGSAGDGGWYEIVLEDGTTGYVSGDYVSVE